MAKVLQINMFQFMSKSHLPILVLLLMAVGTGHAETYKQTEDIVYAQAHGVAMVMDQFVPTGKFNGRAIVDVASGAWHSDRGKIGDHKKAKVYDLLCARGFMVFAVRPGSIEKFSAPEMLDHLNRAISHVKEQAEQYQFDASKLGLMGASAGGHLACLAAVTANASTQVKAVGVFFRRLTFSIMTVFN